MASSLTAAQSALLPSAVQFAALRRGDITWDAFIAPTQDALNPAPPAPVLVTSRRNTARLIQPPELLIDGSMLRKMWHVQQRGQFLVGTTTEKRNWVIRDTVSNLDVQMGTEKDKANLEAALAAATAQALALPPITEEMDLIIKARIASDKTAR